jgi:hypothetical protein
MFRLNRVMAYTGYYTMLRILVAPRFTAVRETGIKQILELKVNFVGFQVPTEVVVKSSIVWDIIPCSPGKANRRFGVIYCLNLHGQE